MFTITLQKQAVLVLSLITIFFTACEKTQIEYSNEGEALVNINVDGFDFESETQLLATTNTTPSSQKSPIHIQYAKDGFYIESQLVNGSVSSQKTHINNKGNLNAGLKELDSQVRYLLLVYNEKGNLAASREYVYGQETLEKALALNSNTLYTFIVVSSRSTTYVPSVKNISSLEDAEVVNVNADLLYWSKKTKLSPGDNFLAARLKPQFSEITTTLQMDPNMTGSITAISKAVFNPVAQEVSLKLANGSLSYGTLNNTGKQATFPSLGSGSRQITSLPTTLIHSETNSASLTFGSLQVDGETKTNITVAGLSIKPGHRYHLILTLKTCTEDVKGNPGLDWNYPEYVNKNRFGYVIDKGIMVGTKYYKNGEQLTREYVEKGADYGFVIDIERLDNSFNLEINGSKMADKEIQFQSDAATAQNIQFEDGSQYQGKNVEGGNVPAIWNLKGTPTNPIVKVVISRTGEVTMYGSKESGGKLYPLRLKNGTKFNKFVWAPGSSQSNVVKVTTIIDGETIIKGTGSGKIKVSCNK